MCVCVCVYVCVCVNGTMDNTYMCIDCSILRPGKVESQFIVQLFTILHEGGTSFFIIHYRKRLINQPLK